MNLFQLAILAALTTVSTACDTDPGKGKAHAAVGAPVSTSAASATPASGAVLYHFDNQDSKLEFVGAKVTRKHPGSFGGFRGTVTIQDGDPSKGKVNVEIDTATLTVDVPKLTNHLKTPDFFDVAKFPSATFTSTSVQSAGGAYSVTGNLGLHGVSKSITFPAAIKVSGDYVDAQSEFAINRKDFGIVYPGAPDDLIQDDVLIKLSLHAKKQ